MIRDALLRNAPHHEDADALRAQANAKMPDPIDRYEELIPALKSARIMFGVRLARGAF